MDKQAIRQAVLKQRQQLAPSDHALLSCQVLDRLVVQDFFQSAQKIASYSAIRQEVDADLLLEQCQLAHRQIFLPRVVGDTLAFHAVASRAELVVGAFGVCEPLACGEAAALADFDLVIVPGVAFDVNGYRLGYGKGFYDRFLAVKPEATVTVGLCFDFQVFERLPSEAHDQSLDYVLTEKRIIPCHMGVAGL